MKNQINFIFLFSLLAFQSYCQISFLPYQIYPIGSYPKVVIIEDFNNDGLNDVVLGTGFFSDPTEDYKLFIYYQDLSGNLMTPVNLNYPHFSAGITSITSGDFNNDNLTDLVIGFAGYVGIYYQDQTGLHDPIITYNCVINVNSVKSGDFNNDGLDDVAASLNNTEIKIFYQSTTGFTNQTILKPQSQHEELESGDVNGDGKYDLVLLPGESSTGVLVYLQNINGTLDSAISYPKPASILFPLRGIDIGDMNNDGLNDIVATAGGNTPYSKTVFWYQDPLSHLFLNPIITAAYDVPEPLEISDLNCDGKNEIIILHGGWQNVSVYSQDSLGNYGPYALFPLTYASHYTPQGLSIGDINNDGKKDIAIADYNYGLLTLQNNSTGNCTTTSSELIETTSSEINLYPNPFHSSINITFPAIQSNTVFNVKITNLIGNLIKELKLKSFTQEVNLENLSSGIYTLTIETGDKRISKKLVKL